MGFWWDFSNVCLGMVIIWMTLGIASAIKDKENKQGLIGAMIMSAPGFIIYMWVHLGQ